MSFDSEKGSDMDDEAAKSAEVYDIKSDKWTKLPDMPHWAAEMTFARLGDLILISSR